MISGESVITQMTKAHLNSRYSAYELFGVDVLLDETLKPWLLEVSCKMLLSIFTLFYLRMKYCNRAYYRFRVLSGNTR